MRKLCTIVVITMSLVGVTSSQEKTRVELEDMLSTVELKSIGANKLNEEESENLRLILIDMYDRAYKLGIEKGREDALEYMSSQWGTASVVESQIDGDFEGWEGETVVKLMNGQVWEQTEYYYHYHYAFMPSVLIYKSGGQFKMKVDGIDKAVGVTRLR